MLCVGCGVSGNPTLCKSGIGATRPFSRGFFFTIGPGRRFNFNLDVAVIGGVLLWEFSFSAFVNETMAKTEIKREEISREG